MSKKRYIIVKDSEGYSIESRDLTQGSQYGIFNTKKEAEKALSEAEQATSYAVELADSADEIYKKAQRKSAQDRLNKNKKVTIDYRLKK